MIAPAKPRRSRKRPGTAWHVGFLRMLPKIVRHARVILPRLRPEARADALQEVAANAAVAYARLAELGKEDLACRWRSGIEPLWRPKLNHLSSAERSRSAEQSRSRLGSTNTDPYTICVWNKTSRKTTRSSSLLPLLE